MLKIILKFFVILLLLVSFSSHTTIRTYFQLGVAIGFLLPPIMVKNNDDKDLVGKDLQVMFSTMVGITTALSIATIICEFLKIDPSIIYLFIYLTPHRILGDFLRS